ncbi:MAG: tetratricopeptide repeat protein [Thiomicrorhabdus sp.]|nr:tetratricopeptide repeat protein [Thiomicrorhabdus sp.]
MQNVVIKRIVFLCFSCVILFGCVVVTEEKPVTKKISDNGLELAFQAYRDGRLGDSERFLLALLKDHTELPEAWFKLANIYYRTGRYDAAVRAYEKTVAYDKKNGRAWFNLALTRIQQADAALLEGEQHALEGSESYKLIRGLRKRLQSSPTKQPQSIDAENLQSTD